MIEVELLIDVLIVVQFSQCFGDSIVLNFDFNVVYIYFWGSYLDINDFDQFNLVVQFLEIMVYVVMVLDVVGNCSLEIEVMVEVVFDLSFNFFLDIMVCVLNLILQASDFNVIFYSWYVDVVLIELFGGEDMLQVSLMGVVVYYVLVRDVFGCIVVDFVIVIGNVIEVIIISQGGICLGVFGVVVVINQDFIDMLIYLWVFDFFFVFGNDNFIVFIVFFVFGGYGLMVSLEN